MQGIVVVITAAFVLVNLCIDLAYGLIDPRVARSLALARRIAWRRGCLARRGR